MTPLHNNRNKQTVFLSFLSLEANNKNSSLWQNTEQQAEHKKHEVKTTHSLDEALVSCIHNTGYNSL